MSQPIEQSTKSEIRKQVKAARLAQTSQFYQQATQQIATLLCELDAFKQARHIAAYLPMPGEASPLACIEQALQAKKQVYFPKVLAPSGQMAFYPADANTPLASNQYNILEPAVGPNDKPISPGSLDLVLVPLVAFDKQGNRLGMGKGYYDKTFGPCEPCPTLIGIAYALQHIENLPAEPHDVQLSAVVTESTVYKF